MAETTSTGPLGAADFRALVAAVAQAVAAAGSKPLLLSQAEAITFTGLSRSAFFRLKSAGKLPKPVKLDGTEVLYRRADLEKWAERLKSAARPPRGPGEGDV